MAAQEPYGMRELETLKEPLELQRSPAATATVKVRHAELQTFVDRLRRVANDPRAPRWEQRSQLCYGAAAGGFVGFWPFVAQGPSAALLVGYAVVVLVLAIIGFLCGRAREDIATERVEQVSAIREDLETYILNTFETPEEAARRLGPTRPSQPQLPAADAQETAYGA